MDPSEVTPTIVTAGREHVSRRWGAVASSLLAHFALLGLLWSAQSRRFDSFRVAGGQASAPLTASLERPRPTEEPIVERMLPTEVRVERDHAHVDRQLFVPLPQVDEPPLESKPDHAEPHD